MRKTSYQGPVHVRRTYEPTRRWRAKIHVEPFNGVKSPYDGATGTVIGEMDCFDRDGGKITTCIVRLDKPNTPKGITEVCFDAAHLRKI